MFRLRLIKYCCLFFITLIVGKSHAQNGGYINLVNPFIGTTESEVKTKWGEEGGTYPGAVAPSGSIQISPETGNRGYDYSDNSILYFSCFGHSSGFPHGSVGDIFLMPIDSVEKFELKQYKRPFDHSNEQAKPGYYRIQFSDDSTKVEALATPRTGVFKLTFKKEIEPHIFIGGGDTIFKKSEKLFYISFHKYRFVFNFNEKPVSKEKKDHGVILSFEPSLKGEKQIKVKLSRSSVSFENATKNLRKEIGDLGFAVLRNKSQRNWKNHLSVIDVFDHNSNNKVKFYTAFYHSLLVPQVIDDVDGKYRGDDNKIHRRHGENQYGKFSPWDTFRTLHPFLTLFFPEKENDIIKSLLDKYRQTGRLYAGPMTGNHAIPIIVDSYMKGVSDYDAMLAYKAMKKSVMDTSQFSPEFKSYVEKGYVPYNFPESVTKTVEFSYDDWVLSRFSKKTIGNTEDSKILNRRGLNYRNLFNKDLESANELFLLPRKNNNFLLDPRNKGYKEGNKWIYSSFVPQNGKDLINLRGGGDYFSKRLDSVLSKKEILFDNETMFHVPFLFNLSGRPDLTQKWSRKIMNERFFNSPGGIPGNDDLGSMSSWFVFNALGIYPFVPGKALYTFGTPLFRKTELHLSNGENFTITGNSSHKNKFIHFVSVNGKPWKDLTLSHSLLKRGGTMHFTLGEKAGEWFLDSTSVELSETKSTPNFKITNCHVKNYKVEPNESFYVYFDISNAGARGTKKLNLTANKSNIQSKNIFLKPGQQKHDSIEAKLYTAGKVDMQLEECSDFSMQVVPANTRHKELFKISQVNLNPLIEKGKDESLSYKIQNVSGYTENFRIPVKVNNSVVFIDTLALHAGEKRELNHEIETQEEGKYTVRVAFSSSFYYKVYDDPLASSVLDFQSLQNNSRGIIKDRSGFNNDGYVIDPDSNSVSYSSKRTGGTFKFDKNHHVKIKNSEVLNNLDSTLTMMAWVYPTNPKNGLVDIMAKGDNHVLQVSDGKTLSFFAGGWGHGSAENTLPDGWKNNWHHIAGVCTGKKLKLYIDGDLKGTTELKNTVDLYNRSNWTLGTNEEFLTTRIYDGFMGNVKIFKAALSSDKIKAIREEEMNNIKCP